MFRLPSACAFGAIWLAVAPVFGDDVAELRRLLDALQTQLQKIEKGEKPNQRVTEIGGARLPSARVGEEIMIVRIYDLSDLFAVAPPYVAMCDGDLSGESRPLFPVVRSPSSGSAFGGGLGGGFGMGGMGGAGSGVFDVPARTSKSPHDSQPALHQAESGSAESPPAASPATRTTIDDLISAITSTIAPDTWEEVGGPASINQLGAALLVSASQQTHEQINALLDLFRKRWGSLQTVSLRAYWVWLRDDELAQVLTDGQGAAQIRAYGLVNEAKWRELLQQAGSENGPSRVAHQASVTCYNGQTVHTLAGGRNIVVAGMKPVVGGGEGAPGYEPTVSVVQEGAALQITPMATKSGKYVTLDIHSRVAQLRPEKSNNPPREESKSRSIAGESLQAAASIDRPVLMIHRLSTTLRAPTEHPILVGGMTFDQETKPGEPALYLFVKVWVQELREDASGGESREAAETKPSVAKQKKQARD